MPRLYSGAAIGRPETTKLPPIPEVFWQQPQEVDLIDIYVESTNNIKREKDIEAQSLPINETSSQVSGIDTESLLENQIRSTPVQCRNDSKKQQHGMQ